MPASVRSSASAAADAGNVTVTKPAGTVDGDLLLAVCFADPDGAAVTAPAGWTQVGLTHAPATRGFGTVFRKAASGEGASYVFTGSSGSSNNVMVVAVTGHDAATPVDVAATWGDGGNATAHIAPSISPTGSDSLLVCGFYGLVSGVTASYTPPGGMAEQSDLQPTGRWIVSSLATVGLAASGATGTKTATCTANRQYIGVSVAIKSAGGGAPSVEPDGVAVPVALGSPSLAWSASVAPDGMAVPVALGSPTATAQSIAAPDGVAVPVALGSPSLVWSAGVAPDGLSVPVALGAPIVGAASVNPDGATVPVTLGDPSLSWTGSVSPDGISVPVALGSPIIGAAPLAPDGISVPVTLGAPSLAWSGSVSPDGLSVPVAIGTPSLNISGAFVTRPNTGGVVRPGTGTVARPSTGSVTRPASGTVTRPDVGVVSRP